MPTRFQSSLHHRSPLTPISIMSTGLLVLLFISSSTLLVSGCGNKQDEQAKARLNDMLGRHEQQAPWWNPFKNNPPQQAPLAMPNYDESEELATTPFEMLGNLMNERFNGAFGLEGASAQNGLQIQETRDAYIIKAPASDSGDPKADAQANEKALNVAVTPFRIQLSGQITNASGNGAFKSSSSFMRTFTPKQEVVPDKVTRTVEDNHVVVTVPKRFPSESLGGVNGMENGGLNTPPRGDTLTPNQRLHPTRKRAKQLPPELLEQLNEPPNEVI